MTSEQTFANRHSNEKEISMRKSINKKSFLYLHQNTIKAIFIIIAIILTTIILIGHLSLFSKASELDNDDNVCKLYKSYEIKEGDSLWSIAKDNCNFDYQSMNDYLDEVVECNKLLDDKLQPGNFLIIPYYTVYF